MAMAYVRAHGRNHFGSFMSSVRSGKRGCSKMTVPGYIQLPGKALGTCENL